MWICFDCRKVNCPARCKEQHRSLNIDFRGWNDSWVIIFVGNVLYTDADFELIIKATSQVIKDKRHLSYREHKTIEMIEDLKILQTITYGEKKVDFAILTEQQWQDIQRKVAEAEYEGDLALMNSWLEKIYIDIIMDGKVSAVHDYELNSLKRCIRDYGYKFVKKLKERVESNEWISEKLKAKVMEMLLEDIL